MAPIDGPIELILKMCNPQTISKNIFKFQPSKASGLGGVRLKRQKSAAVLYKYRLDILAAHAASIASNKKGAWITNR